MTLTYVTDFHLLKGSLATTPVRSFAIEMLPLALRLEVVFSGSTAVASYNYLARPQSVCCGQYLSVFGACTACFSKSVTSAAAEPVFGNWPILSADKLRLVIEASHEPLVSLLTAAEVEEELELLLQAFLLKFASPMDEHTWGFRIRRNAELQERKEALWQWACTPDFAREVRELLALNSLAHRRS